LTPARDLGLETLRLSQEDRVLVAAYDQPPLNFMTDRLLRDLDELTRAADEDHSVGAVVITGAPRERFITHFDLSELLEDAERAGVSYPTAIVRGGLRVVAALGAAPPARRAVERTPVGGIVSMRRHHEVVTRMARSGIVYVAAVNGPALGGGFELAVACDVRLVSDAPSVRLGLPELLIGITTAAGSQRLGQLVGTGRALGLMLEGRLLQPAEAVEMGLARNVVSADRLLDEARAHAAPLARRNRDAVAAQKRAFYEDAARSPSESLRREAASFMRCLTLEPVRRALRDAAAAGERAQESPFLSDPRPWADGTAVDLND
jgi:enoyl-CoA hydratase